MIWNSERHVSMPVAEEKGEDIPAWRVRLDVAALVDESRLFVSPE
jgi:hypothetical protein